MRLFSSFGSGIAAATLAFAALPTQSQAVVYTLDLTGVVADASPYTVPGGGGLTLGLSGFDAFEVAVGDEVVINLTLDDSLLVPAADLQVFGIDLLGLFAGLNFSNTSSSSLTFLDGDLAGQTFGAACSNCFAAIAGRSPGDAYSFQTLTASILITGTGEPITFTQAELRYQYGQGGPTGAVPEPSTWAAMILGFGLAGAGLRRRKAFA